MMSPPGSYSGGAMPPLPEPSERPRSISVIGWVSLVFSALLASKALIDIAVWKAMGSAVPSLLGRARDPSLDLPYVRTVLAHLTEIKLAQAAAWVVVAVIAIGLLRLKPWARVGMQIVGAGVLLYFAGLLVLWARAWNSPGLDSAVPPLSEASRLTLLAGGMAMGLILAGIVLSMILVLRRPRIREAFDNARTV
jgi:hypothetical protein